MRALLLLAALFVGCDGCVRRVAPDIPVPAAIYTYDPPQIYWRWAEELATCVQFVAKHDTSFRIERALPPPDSIVWRAVPTEASNGQFRWGKYGGIIGLTFAHAGADTIFVSGQGIFMRSLVKHELMHIMVESAGEWRMQHGTPWGLCEFT